MSRARRAGRRARVGAIATLVIAALAGAGLLALTRAQAPIERPELMLLTSLPLVFGEEMSLEGNGSPALAALEKRFEVRTIDVTDSASLTGGRLLLMAQPRAQPAEALVDLDRWVRGGGRLLLLADPLLEWPSERPIGDVLRASAAFADTGLLRHWGLTLYLPDRRGPKQQSIGDYSVLTVSPGSLEGRCAVESGGLVARCAIGKGRATVIADADFLDPGLDGRAARNLDSLVAELTRLASSDSQADEASTELSTGMERENNPRTGR